MTLQEAGALLLIVVLVRAVWKGFEKWLWTVR